MKINLPTLNTLHWALILIASVTIKTVLGQNSGVAVIYDAVTPSSYTVVENAGPLVACIRAIGTVQSEFTVTMTTSDQFGSATAGVDYNDIVATVTFEPFSTLTRCSTIPIIDDNIVENEEFYFLSLSSEDTSVSLPSFGTVAITNDDSVSLGFTESSYTAGEGNPAQVCVIILSGSIARNIDFEVTQTDGTASALNEDYVQATLSGSITPAGAASTVCVNVPLNPDTKVEATETIEIHLISPDSIETSDATIFIMDDDGVTVELDSSMLSVSEGNSGTTMLDMCVHLTALQTSSSIHRDVGLLLTTAITQGQADSDDFLPLSNEPLTIPMSTPLGNNVCYQLEITGDQVCEGDEIFTVSVTPSNSLDTVIGADTVTVTIQDDGDCNPGNCGPLESPENGDINQPSPIVANSVARFTCDEGYILGGSTNRVCRTTGQWTGITTTCTSVDCLGLQSPENGIVNLTMTTFTGVANYSCDEGFSLEGDVTRTCLSNGTWSGNEPTCRAVDCLALQPPLNGVVTVTNTTFMSTANYSCDEGFSLEGDVSVMRTCLFSGTWSGNEPTCRVIDCGPPSNPDNGSVTVGPTTFNAIAVYKCDNGYVLYASSFIRKCQRNSTWTGEDPSCHLSDCGVPEMPLNGLATYTTTTYLSVTDYTCNVGYNINGVISRTCQADEEWSGSVPTCEIVECPILEAPNNGGLMLSDFFLFNSRASYTCNQGYNLVDGSSNRICRATGQWTSIAPTCNISDCGVPEMPSNGLAIYTTTTYLSVTDYTCNVGYNINGVISRTCQADEEWSGSVPTCEIVDCSLLSDPPNGRVDVNRTAEGAMAVYSCNNNHFLSGDVIRVCMTNSQWSGNEPICIRVSAPSDSNTALIIGVAVPIVVIIVIVISILTIIICILKKRNVKRSPTMPRVSTFNPVLQPIKGEEPYYDTIEHVSELVTNKAYGTLDRPLITTEIDAPYVIVDPPKKEATDPNHREKSTDSDDGDYYEVAVKLSGVSKSTTMESLDSYVDMSGYNTAERTTESENTHTSGRKVSGVSMSNMTYDAITTDTDEYYVNDNAVRSSEL